MEVTKRTLYEHGLEAALNAYRAARYRGQFNGDALDGVKKRTVKRRYDQWWIQKYGEVPTESDAQTATENAEGAEKLTSGDSSRFIENNK